MRCADCGGLNAPGAEWCGQCFKRFARPGAAGGSRAAPKGGPELGEERLVVATDPAPRAQSGDALAGGERRGAFTVGEQGITWSCAVCETAQPLDRSTCSVCGANFADALRSSARERSPKDPNTAALLSLLFPGAGHAYLGLWGQMVARAVLSGFVAIVFVLTAATRGAPALLSSAFGLSAFGLWVAGAHDAYFEASDESSRVWLKSGAFVYVVLGLLCLLFGAMVVSFFKARASF